MDALNAIGPAKDIVVVGGGKSELDAYVEKLAKMTDRTVKAEPTPEKGFYYRSDHFSFAKLGVPMFNFGSGDELVEGGVEAGQKAAEDYEKNRYHAPDRKRVGEGKGVSESVELGGRRIIKKKNKMQRY